VSGTWQVAPGARHDVSSAGPTLRVAIVGTGSWWGRQHARAFAERADTEVVAVVGRTEDSARDRATAVGARPYGDIDTMLAAEHPDLVSVCLPSGAHFDTTLRLIRAGVPLFIEKPLVFDRAEADALIQEAADRGAFVAIDFNHRYARPVELAKTAIDAGRTGEMMFALWRFGGEGDARQVDGNLIETQCHGFDMLEYLVGPIGSVAAQFTDFPGRGHSSLAIALGFENGAVGSLVGSYDTSYAYPDSHRLEINGTKGRLVISDTVRRFEFQPVGSEVAEVWQAGYFNDLDRAFHRTLDRHVDDVVRALRAGEAPPVPASAGRRALELAFASIQSFETGQRIATPSGPAGVSA
jgi:myo-inositol 2-dehydrogenase/D-chiro-inositol 1-dehydrogenase